MTTYHRTVPRPLGRSPLWNPWSSLANELLRDGSPMFQALDPSLERSRGVFPPVNLHETADGYVLTAELPGVAPEDMDVSIEGATVTLSGERKIELAAGDGVAVHRRERQSGTFRRAFELPAEIHVEEAKATHRNGVLTLALPKSPAVKPRQIEIETR